MTPAALRSALRTLHWSQRALAAELGCDERLVRRWALGAAPVPPEVGGWLTALLLAREAVPAPRWRVGKAR
jgi:ribosome-binding protein aMBF1 (putative translation factor)